jgi:hypothetical protein
MDTKSNLKQVYNYILFLLLLVGACLSLAAQCPSNSDYKQQPIWDDSNFSINEVEVSTINEIMEVAFDNRILENSFSKGIQRNCFKGIGYGEMQPLNNCAEENM